MKTSFESDTPITILWTPQFYLCLCLNRLFQWDLAHKRTDMNLLMYRNGTLIFLFFFIFSSFSFSADGAKNISSEKTSKNAASVKKPKKDKNGSIFDAEEDEEDLGRTTGPASIDKAKLIEKDFGKTDLADKKRDEAIKDLLLLIQKAVKDSPRKADMIFRLAELYWEKSRFLYYKEYKEYEKVYEKWVNAGGKGNAPKIPDYTRGSEVVKKQALNLYKKVLAEYPSYARNDEVLFFLGFNEYEAGNHDKAVSHYWELIKKFPKSKYVGNSYLNLGEHFFNTNNVLKAKKAYEKAYEGADPANASYALYKLAWCDFNIQEYGAGIEKLKKVIVTSDQNKAQKSVQLKGEALNDLALFFAHTEEVDGAYRYYRSKISDEETHKQMAKLAKIYNGQGKHNFEVAVYKLLIEKEPYAEKAPSHQSAIVRAFASLNQKDLVRENILRLIEQYRPGSPWYKYQEQNKKKDAIGKAYDLTENALRELVTEYHQDAQKTKDVLTYELARDIYKQYIDFFPESEHAYRMRFFYAEILFHLGEYELASKEYDRVVKHDVNGAYTKTAAYAAILSHEKIVSGVKKEKKEGKIGTESKNKKGNLGKIELGNKLEKGKNYAAEVIPSDEQALADACEVYFKIAPKDDAELPAIKFKASYIYFKHNHFVEAAKRYTEIIERWPANQLAQKAAHLVLDSLNIKEDWANLEKYARNYADNATLIGKDTKYKQEIWQLVEAANFKQILEDQEKLDKSASSDKTESLAHIAQRFKKFQNEFSGSQYADKAMFNAVMIFQKAKHFDDAQESGEFFLEKFPNSEHVESIVLAMANIYENLAHYKKAADLYSNFAEKYTKSDKRADAYYNAALYYESVGNKDKAVSHYEKYIRLFEKRDDTPKVYLKLAGLFDEASNYKTASTMYSEFPKKFAKQASEADIVFSKFRFAEIKLKEKKYPEAEKVFKEIATDFVKYKEPTKKDPRVQHAGAYSLFTLTEPQWVEYQKLKITINIKSLDQKTAALQNLISEDPKTPGKYIQVLLYGNAEYGIASLTRIGIAYQEFAQSLIEAPIPPGLTPEQEEIYTAELNSQASPLEEKAIEAFEKALVKSNELHLYTDWSLQAQELLAKYTPDEFPELFKNSFHVSDVTEMSQLPAIETIEIPEASEPKTKAGDATSSKTSEKKTAKL